jgi:anti-sigma factor RsiW
MNCDQLAERASEIVEGGLAAERAQVDAHLAICARCRALVADLRLIRQTAATLDRRVPPAQLWTGIAAQLEAEPGFRRASAVAGPPVHQRPPAWAWLAAAAVLVAMVGGGLYYVARSMRPPQTAATSGGGATGNASSTALVESIGAELDLAAQHYEKAIAGLEQIASQSDSPLDPELTAMLRKNLGVIDLAIEQSREALRAQPDSRVAQESLFEAFRRKIALLQDTIALMNEMRKGNEAGAARIVEGLNKS